VSEEYLKVSKDYMNKLPKALFIYLLVASPVLADVTVSWTAPTAREDGMALPASEIAGYIISYTRDSVSQSPITTSPLTSAVIAGPVGRYCVTLQTLDTDGLVSDPTTPVCNSKGKPRKPTNVTVR
jgi:hypothetical protein